MGKISEKLKYLRDTKTAIKEAIEAHGEEVGDTDTFRQYAEIIRDLTPNSLPLSNWREIELPETFVNPIHFVLDLEHIMIVDSDESSGAMSGIYRYNDTTKEFTKVYSSGYRYCNFEKVDDHSIVLWKKAASRGTTTSDLIYYDLNTNETRVIASNIQYTYSGYHRRFDDGVLFLFSTRIVFWNKELNQITIDYPVSSGGTNTYNTPEWIVYWPGSYSLGPCSINKKTGEVVPIQEHTSLDISSFTITDAGNGCGLYTYSYSTSSATQMGLYELTYATGAVQQIVPDMCAWTHPYYGGDYIIFTSSYKAGRIIYNINTHIGEYIYSSAPYQSTSSTERNCEYISYVGDNTFLIAVEQASGWVVKYDADAKTGEGLFSGSANYRPLMYTVPEHSITLFRSYVSRFRGVFTHGDKVFHANTSTGLTYLNDHRITDYGVVLGGSDAGVTTIVVDGDNISLTQLHSIRTLLGSV